MRTIVLLLALAGFALPVQSQDADPGSVYRGANLYRNCDVDLGGRNSCLEGTLGTYIQGNGRACYDCHRFNRNGGLDESRVAEMSFVEPYWQAAFNVPDLEDLRMLSKGIIKTDSGFKNSATLKHLQVNCGYDPENCFLALGHMAEKGHSLPVVIQDAIRQHMTLTVGGEAGIDYEVLSPEKMSDLIAFLLSDEFQTLMETQTP